MVLKGKELVELMHTSTEMDNLVLEAAGTRLNKIPQVRATPSARALLLYTWLKQNSNPWIPRFTYINIKIEELLKHVGFSRSTFYRARLELEGLGLLCVRRRAYMLNIIVRHTNLRVCTANLFIEAAALNTDETGVEHLWAHNIYNYTRQYTCQVHVSNTCFTRKYMHVHVSNTHVHAIKHEVVNLYSDRRFYFMGKKNGQLNLDLPRHPDEIPRMFGKPLLVSSIAQEEHNFPYVSTGLNISAFWYWAIQRYRKLGLDFAVTESYIKKSSIIFGRYLLPVLMTWEAIREYIDWYLARTDHFAQVTCSHNFNYMISMACLNLFKNSSSKLQRIVSTDQERKEAKTSVATSIDELNAEVERRLKAQGRGLRGLKGDMAYVRRE